MEQKNDWFASLLMNPDKDYDNFKDAGYNSVNTVLKDKATYAAIPEVKDRFTNDDGSFNDNLFNQYYNRAAQTYNTFIGEDTTDKYMNELSTSVFDTREATKDRKKETPKFLIRHIPNPQEMTMGTAGVFSEGKPKWSMREVAQTQRVWDSEEGSWRDYKPNDFFDSMFGAPLVEAKWDEDGTHKDKYGRDVRHQAGEWKLNDEGNPYYETLGDRDTTGKQFLHWQDVFSDDGSFWNKMDFFDSDGLEKSVVGSTMKAIATLAPLFIPGVRWVYGGVGVALAFNDIISGFGKAITELGGPEHKPEAWNILNSMDAFGRRFDSSYSDDDMQSNWSYGKLVGMLSDVSAQLMQQRTIAQLPKLIGNSKNRALSSFLKEFGADKPTKLGGKTLSEFAKGKNADEVLKYLDPARQLKLQSSIAKQYEVGAELSSMYMSAVQARSVYDSLKENNFDEKSIMLGLVTATLGYYGLMKTELGQWVLKGAGIDEVASAIRPIINKHVAEVAGEAAGKTLTQAGKFAVIKSGVNKIVGNVKDLFSRGASGVFNNMAKEATEEVSEELLQDAITIGLQHIENAFTSLDETGWKTKNTYSFKESNPLERYLLAGAGGAMGGAVFKGVDKINDLLAGRTSEVKNAVPGTVLEELEDAVLRYGGDAVTKVIEKEKQKARVLPTTFTNEIDEDASTVDQIVYKTTTDRSQSQNDLMFDNLISFVTGLNTIITNEGLKLDREDVVQSALLKDARLRELASHGMDKLIYDDFTTLSKKLVDAYIDKEDTSKDAEQSNAAQQRYNELKKQMSDLMEGNKSGTYAEMMAFSMSQTMLDPFIQGTVEAYSRAKLNKPYTSLSESEKSAIDAEYAKYKEDGLKWLKASYEIFARFKENSQGKLAAFNQDTGIFAYIKDFQNKIAELDKTQNINNELLPDEVADIRTDIVDGRTLDQIIEQEALNREDNPLTEEQKQEIVDNYIEEETAKRSNERVNIRKISQKSRRMDLGINPILNERGDEELKGLIGLVTELGQQHGFIDEATAKMVNRVITSNAQVDLGQYTRDIAQAVNDGLLVSTEENPENKAKVSSIAKSIINFDNIDLLTNITDSDIGFLPLAINNIINNGGEYEGASISIAHDGENFSKFNPEMDDVMLLDELKNADNISDLSYNPDSGEIKFTLKDPNGDIQEAFEVTVPFTNNDAKLTIQSAMLADAESVDGDVNDVRNLRDLRTFKTAISETQWLNNRLALLDQADAVTSNIRQNPLIDLLSDISMDLIGEDIFELLRLEENAYSKLSNLSSYVIANNVRREKLLRGLDAVKILKSLLYSSTNAGDVMFDINAVINSSRQRNKLEPFQSFTMEQTQYMDKTLDEIAQQIDWLVRVSDANSGSKLSESKKTDIRVSSIIGSIFARNREWLPDALYTGEQGIKVGFFDDITIDETDAATLEKALEDNSESDDDARVASKVVKTLENQVYEKFNGLTEEQQNEVLSSLIEAKDWEEGIINIKRDSTFTDLGHKFMTQWTLNSIAYKTDNFDETYLKVLNKPEALYAPFYAQKLAIRGMYSFYKNPELFNRFLSLMGVANVTGTPQQVIKNFMFTNGDPGSGKTTAVAWFFNNMVLDSDPNSKVWSAAIKKERADNLATVLANKGYDSNELFDELLTDTGKAKYAELKKLIRTGDVNALAEGKINGVSVLSGSNLNSALFTSSDFISNVPKMIIFDEITHLSSFERDLLSQSGSLLMGLGDVNQEGFTINNGDAKQAWSADNVGYFMTTPSLNMSVRANNLNVKDNLDILSSYAKMIDLQLTRKLNLKVPTQFKAINENFKQTSLRFYESGGNLQGHKVMDSDSVTDEYVRGLISKLKDGEVIAYIADESIMGTSKIKILFDKYLNEFPDKVAVVYADDVQGAEFRYTIVDAVWKAPNKTDYDNDFYNNYRKFYTLITRSSDGAILINNPNLPISNTTKLSYPAIDSSLDESDITDYKKFVLDTYYNTTVEPVSEVTETPEIKVEEVAPKLNIQDRDKLEAAYAERQENQEDEEFLTNNLQIVTSHNSDGVGYEGEVDEDLSHIITERRGNQYENAKQALFKLKSLFLRDLSDPNVIDELFKTNRTSLSIMSPFIDTYLGNEDYDTFKEAIKQGGYKIKVRGFDPKSDKSINSTYGSKYRNPNKGSKYAKVVYQIPIGGRTLDITVGVINLNNASLNPLLKDRIDSMESGYIDIKSPNIQLSPIRYRQQITGEEKDPTKFNQNDTTLRKMRKEHPELKFSEQMYVKPIKEQSGKQNAAVVAFVTYDLWNTKSLYNDYLNQLSIRDSDTNVSIVSPAYTSLIGRDYKTFANEWASVLKKEGGVNVSELNKLTGYMTATKLYYALSNFNRVMQTGKMDKYIDTSDPEVAKFFEEFLADPESKEYADIIAESQSLMTSLGNVLYNKHWKGRNADAVLPRYLKGDYSDNNFSLSDPDFNNLLRKIARTVEEDGESQVPILTAISKAQTDEVLADTGWSDAKKDLFKSEMQKLYDLLDTFTSNGMSFNTNALLNLYENNILVGLWDTYAIMSAIVRTTEMAENPVVRDTTSHIMDLAVRANAGFRTGIWYNPVDLGKTKTDEGYYPSDLSFDQVYLDGPIQLPHMYIGYDSLMLDTETSNEEAEAIEDTTPTDTRTPNEIRLDSILNSMPEELSLRGNPLDSQQDNLLLQAITSTVNENADADSEYVVERINEKLSNGSITPLVVFENGQVRANDNLTLELIDGNYSWGSTTNESLNVDIQQQLATGKPENNGVTVDPESGIFYYLNGVDSAEQPNIEFWRVGKRKGKFEINKLTPTQLLNYEKLVQEAYNNIANSTVEPIVHTTTLEEKVTYPQFLGVFQQTVDVIPKANVLYKALDKAMDVDNGKYYNKVVSLIYNKFGNKKVEIISSDLSEINDVLLAQSEGLAKEISETLNEMISNNPELGLNVVKENVVRNQLIKRLVDIKYNEINCM